MIPIPRFTADGLLDYAGLALGLSVGFALLRGVGASVEEAISKR